MQKKRRIKNNMKYITLFVSLLFVLPIFSQAETVLRTGTDISVEEQQSVEGDYYVSVGPMGRTVMSGNVSEDMYAVGASVTVNGEVGNDLSILAGDVQVHAPVADDVRVIGGEVTIAEDVGGDVFVIAGTLSVLSTATIAGDVFFFGGDLVIDGDVEGSVLGQAQSVTVNASVGGDFDMKAPAGVTLGDGARIAGSVRYTSYVTLSRSAGAEIVGDVQKSQSEAITTKQKTRDILVPIFITLFATLSLYLLLKKELEFVVRSVENMFIKNLLIGTGLIILGPVTAVVLLVTVLGLFVGLIALSVVSMLYVSGLALSSVVLGAFIMRLMTKKLEVTLTVILVGTVALQLLLLIPVLGFIAGYVLFALTVGALTQQLYKAVI